MTERDPPPPVAEDSLRWAVEQIGNRFAQMQMFDSKVEELLRKFDTKVEQLLQGMEQIQQALARLQAILPAPPPAAESDPDPDPDSPLSRSVNELELTVRTAHCLENDLIKTIGQLVEKTPAELMHIPNFGRASLRNVVEALQQLGLQLKTTAAA